MIYEKIKREAHFSDCGRYRYWLTRVWNTEIPLLTFIGLNPSTANHLEDDPTIRRVISFAKREKYGGVLMLNLFALVSSDPKVLLTNPEAVGPENNYYLNKKGPVVFCWGAFPEANKRSKEIINKFPDAFCLGKTKDGHPKHPLYLAGNTPLIKFHSKEVPNG